MAGSQLSQLKSALNNAGLSRNNSSGGKKNKSGRKSHSSSAKDRLGGDVDARNRKLESISQSLNRFDIKTTNTKHKIVNAKPLKGSTGRPGLSRQAGIENRKKTLLPQYLDRNRTGGIVDRRFGEDNPTLTPEEKALQRFTLERQRKANKTSLFNLGDNEEAGGLLGGLGDDEGLGGETLTHYGQSLGDVRGALVDQEDFFKKSLHEPGLERGGEDGKLERKKSRAEVMEEVIAKSKAYKYERQKLKHEDEEERMQLDDDLAAIRGMLGAPNTRSRLPVAPTAAASTEVPAASPPSAAVDGKADGEELEEVEEEEGDEMQDEDEAEEEEVGGDDDDETGDVVNEQQAPVASTSQVKLTFIKAPTESTTIDQSLLAKLIGKDRDDAAPTADADEAVLSKLKRRRRTEEDDIAEADTDDPYDRFVRELAFDKRAAPSDRLRTAAERAQEAAEELQRNERNRLKRMRGEAGSDDDALEGDNDDMISKKRKRDAGKGKNRIAQGDDLDDGFELDGDESAGFGLGGGLRTEGEDSAEEDDEEGGIALEGEGDGEESDDDEEDEDDAGSDTGSEKEENQMLADLLHDDGSEAEDNDEDDAGPSSLILSRKQKKSGQSSKSKKKEIPYTFPCPASHEDFLELLEGLAEEDLPVVLERIRTLYHPSLAEGNKQKLATFLGVLIDHLIYVASAPLQSFQHSTTLLGHILPLARTFPITCAKYSVSKLTLMQKNLSRGLQSGPLASTSKTWPGAGELSLLRTVGSIWSTSDFAHPVVAPAMLLISQYLGQCRVRNIKDLASGLFLCTLALQYESLSKRLVPEALNFLAQAVVLLFPSTSAPDSKIPGSFPMPDADQEELDILKLGKKDKPATEQLDLVQALQAEDTNGSVKAELAQLTLTLLAELSAMYNTLPAFIELFDPILRMLEVVDRASISDAVQVANLQDSLSRMLKFSRQARRPLTLQSHKPIPIPSFIPKFDASYAPGRRFDPDSERNEAAKLKALVKKEKKGAIRELRKDTRFLAGEKAKMQREKDDAYKTKINKITAGLEQERSEEKRFERTKDRMKSRDKKRAGGGGKPRGGGAGGRR